MPYNPYFNLQVEVQEMLRLAQEVNVAVSMTANGYTGDQHAANAIHNLDNAMIGLKREATRILDASIERDAQ